LQAVYEATFHRLTIPLVEVVASQITVDGAVNEHVIRHDENGVGDGDRRPGPTAASGQASVLRPPIVRGILSDAAKTAKPTLLADKGYDSLRLRSLCMITDSSRSSRRDPASQSSTRRAC
jgi:hypothetical protein